MCMSRVCIHICMLIEVAKGKVQCGIEIACFLLSYRFHFLNFFFDFFEVNPPPRLTLRVGDRTDTKGGLGANLSALAWTNRCFEQGMVAVERSFNACLPARP